MGHPQSDGASLGRVHLTMEYATIRICLVVWATHGHHVPGTDTIHLVLCWDTAPAAGHQDNGQHSKDNPDWTHFYFDLRLFPLYSRKWCTSAHSKLQTETGHWGTLVVHTRSHNQCLYDEFSDIFRDKNCSILLWIGTELITLSSYSMAGVCVRGCESLHGAQVN